MPKRERMAKPATQFAKRPSGTGAIQVDEAASEFVGPVIEIRSIPLKLAPLLTSYKSHGRISIRVERLPHRTRLSAGQNNGDQSWSVSLDELAGLAYQFPSDIRESPTLAVRVINRDGATVAVLDYRVSPSDAVLDMACDPDETAREAAARTASAEIHDLRAELAKAKTELSARESAFVELQQRTARNWEERSQKLIDEALVKSRTEQDAEIAKHLAAVTNRAESALEAARSAWQTEQSARLAETERRSRELNAQTRESWQREADAALAGAQEAWKAGEASRLAAAEARWRKEVGTARAEAARSQLERAEAGHLREELATAKRSLANCERELVRLRSDADQERTGWRQGTETAIAKAKSVWRAEEAIRLAAAETRVREQSAATLTETSARLSRAEAALLEARSPSQVPHSQTDEAELHRLRDELSSVKLKLATHDAELMQVGERARQESEAKLLRAKDVWQAQEGARLAAAEARWREQSEAAMAEAAARRQDVEAALIEARVQADAPPNHLDEDEVRRLHDEVAAMQSKLAYREAEFVQAQERWLQDTDTKLAQAKEAWLAAETARLADVEARARRDSKGALENATARLEKAEAELAELRARPQTEAESSDLVTILRLRDELEKLKIALDVRDIELRHARSATAEALARWHGESHIADQRTHPSLLSNSARMNKARDQEEPSRPLWKDVVLVAGLAALVTVLYPSIASLLPDGWLPQFGYDTEDTDTAIKPPSIPKRPAAPVPAPAAAPAVDIVLRSANVHGDPSKSSAVLATLPRGKKIAPLEQRGNWVLVSIDSEDGSHTNQRGWVYNTYLAPAPDSPAVLPAAAHH